MELILPLKFRFLVFAGLAGRAKQRTLVLLVVSLKTKVKYKSRVLNIKEK